MNKKPGDWDCPKCDHLNFSRRDSCQRCGELRPADGIAVTGGDGGSRGDYGGSRGASYGFGSAYGGGGGGGRGYGAGFADDVRPGDWYCIECNAHNFASRTGCFKCGAYRDEGSDGRRYDSGWRDSRSAYGFGSSYNGGGAAAADAGVAAGTGSRSGWKSGDWICPRTGCKEHNFASRLECFRCSAPRDSPAGM